jgi:hypothetical protein|tara:strand:+ start:664 stop:777 length:114 start_codon:yes stop_codon:yes gene_type:complete
MNKLALFESFYIAAEKLSFIIKVDIKDFYGSDDLFFY